MINRMGKLVSATASDFIILIGILVTGPVAIIKVDESSHILPSCFPGFFSAKCRDALASNSIGFDLFLGALLIFVFIQFTVQLAKLRTAWRKAKIEPIGFFFDTVSKPEDINQTVERSLVEVRRAGGGGLEYRGVGIRVLPNDSLDYWWRARETWVYGAGDGRHKLVFRTAPDDMYFGPRRRNDGRPLNNGEVFNVGVVDYEISDGKPATLSGMFFDYTLDDDHLKRGRIKLNPANDVIPGKERTEAQKVFHSFFLNPKAKNTQRDMIELVKRVARYFK